jgi:hypothetical protein
MDKKFEDWKKNFEYEVLSRENSLANEKRRKDAWEKPECKKIYQELIEIAGGENVVRPGMKGKAKQLAITCYLRGEKPDFKSFVENVEKANKKHEYWKKKKQKRI